MKSYPILGVQVHAVTYESLIELVRGYVATKDTARLIFTPNPEIVYRSRHDAKLRDALNTADINIPDGIGVILASRIYGYPIRERVTGIDACLTLCEQLPCRVFLLGSGPGVAERAAAALEAQYPALSVCGHHHGYFTDSDSDLIVKKINDSGADILFVGLGAPRQELWLLQVKEKLRVAAAMVIGGTLDVVSGEKKRAPLLFQRLRIEWLYRLLQEPRRIGRMSVLPLFLLSVLRDNCKKPCDTLQCP